MKTFCMNRTGWFLISLGFRTTQLDDLKRQLEEISNQRETQVAEFKETYETMRVREKLQNRVTGLDFGSNADERD